MADAIGLAVWWVHAQGRRQGEAMVLEFNRVDADQSRFDTQVGPRGGGWTSMPVIWEISELTYKRNREGEVKIYRIGR